MSNIHDTPCPLNHEVIPTFVSSFINHPALLTDRGGGDGVDTNCRENKLYGDAELRDADIENIYTSFNGLNSLM